MKKHCSIISPSRVYTLGVKKLILLVNDWKSQKGEKYLGKKLCQVFLEYWDNKLLGSFLRSVYYSNSKWKVFYIGNTQTMLHYLQNSAFYKRIKKACDLVLGIEGSEALLAKVDRMVAPYLFDEGDILGYVCANFGIPMPGYVWKIGDSCPFFFNSRRVWKKNNHETEEKEYYIWSQQAFDKQEFIDNFAYRYIHIQDYFSFQKRDEQTRYIYDWGFFYDPSQKLYYWCYVTGRDQAKYYLSYEQTLQSRFDYGGVQYTVYREDDIEFWGGLIQADIYDFVLKLFEKYPDKVRENLPVLLEMAKKADLPVHFVPPDPSLCLSPEDYELLKEPPTNYILEYLQKNFVNR